MPLSGECSQWALCVEVARMGLQVHDGPGGHVLVGPGEDVELANRFLAHLSTRCFAPATRRAYAFDLLSFLRFCAERELVLAGGHGGIRWSV